ncbi:MAG TPA: 2'-5' RNA ligase family protein [Acidimicrobiales bacterium]|nr:2'-5' RNA ligase family protein [Acidimicrobiales bacterium]
MARRRLGVVLLLPEPVSAEVNVLRRALGDTAYGRVPPHITLVPPVNVREDKLDDAVALVRSAAAAESGPIELHLGPAVSFHPVTPVVYLPVGGDIAAVHRLRAAVFQPPLERTVDFEFVPHVTLGDEVAEDAIAGAKLALRGYAADVEIDRITIMEQADDHMWWPLADSTLERAEPRLVAGREFTMTTQTVSTAQAYALGDQRSLAIEARDGNELAGFARGRLVARRAWLDELSVVKRSRAVGLGALLMRRFARAAAAKGATELAALPGVAPVEFLERMGFIGSSTDMFTRNAGP